MKKTLLVLLTTSFIPSTLLANESKSGMYVTGKMGASIMQMEGQFAPYFYQDNFKLEGNTHRTAVFGLGLALGYDFFENFNIPIRTELDFTNREKADYSYSESSFFSTNTIKNQIELNTLMLNVYYDFKNESAFTPYLSAGLGYAYISQKSSHINKTSVATRTLWSYSHASNNFAWSAGAGIKYTINKNFSFDLNYKYLDAGQGEVSHTNDAGVERNAKNKVKSQDIMLSATYHF